MMTKLTVSVPVDLSRRAKARAAQEGTTLSAVLRERLEEFAEGFAGADEDEDVRAAWEVEAGIARGEVKVRDWVDFEAELDAETGVVPGPR